MSELPVTVIIPAYNREGMIGRAVASAFAQKPSPPAQVLVIDDGSTDATADVAEAAGATVVRLTENVGHSGARNVALRNADHDWVALLDSDDEWLPHHLAQLWPLRNGYVLVAGAAIIRSEGTDNVLYGGVLSTEPEVITDPSRIVFPTNFIPASATLVDKNALIAAGGFREGLPRCADMDAWLRLLSEGPALATPVPTVNYYLHGNQVVTDDTKMRDGHLEVTRMYSSKPWYTERAVQRYVGTALWDEFRKDVRARHWRSASSRVAPMARPRRIDGVARTVVHRFKLRRWNNSLNRAVRSGNELSWRPHSNGLVSAP